MILTPVFLNSSHASPIQTPSNKRSRAGTPLTVGYGPLLRVLIAGP